MRKIKGINEVVVYYVISNVPNKLFYQIGKFFFPNIFLVLIHKFKVFIFQQETFKTQNVVNNTLSFSFNNKKEVENKRESECNIKRT